MAARAEADELRFRACREGEDGTVRSPAAHHAGVEARRDGLHGSSRGAGTATGQNHDDGCGRRTTSGPSGGRRHLHDEMTPGRIGRQEIARPDRTRLSAFRRIEEGNRFPPWLMHSP